MRISMYSLNIKLSERKQTAFFTYVTSKSLAKLLNYRKSWIEQMFYMLSPPSPSCSKGTYLCSKRQREDQNCSILSRFQNIFPIAREATKQLNQTKLNKVKIESLRHGIFQSNFIATESYQQLKTGSCNRKCYATLAICSDNLLLEILCNSNTKMKKKSRLRAFQLLLQK